MKIAQAIRSHFKNLSSSQKQVAGHVEGPILVIAGPGSGKTYSIVLRALNLLLLGEAVPKRLVLCTFTEKAAFEMRDRLTSAAHQVNYTGDLSELSISTIHGLCNRILIKHCHRTKLGHGFETLDDLSQLLFIFDHFEDIIGPPVGEKYLFRWKTRWTAITGVRSYFDKIAEELVEPSDLVHSTDPFLSSLGSAFLAYESALIDSNRTDFAHLQRYVYDLLNDPEFNLIEILDLKHILVDEYQDTNYIQEQLLFKLSAKNQNLCVVGDEDQSLYRFRGGTVRNILEFPTHMPNCRIVKLVTNYRSHKDIVERYDLWMSSTDWSNPAGADFRYKKTLQADNNSDHQTYPSMIRISGENSADEANQFADFVQYLMINGVIEDYSQVALLLHSVREKHSGPYIDALHSKGISAFCPRARAYFEISEVQDMIGCFALIFGWYGVGRGSNKGSVMTLAAYVDETIIQLGRRFSSPHPLALALQGWTREIAELEKGQSLDVHLVDYLYRLLALEPFKSGIRDENTVRNIALFSQLLNLFQNYSTIRTWLHLTRFLLSRCRLFHLNPLPIGERMQFLSAQVSTKPFQHRQP